MRFWYTRENDTAEMWPMNVQRSNLFLSNVADSSKKQAKSSSAAASARNSINGWVMEAHDRI